MPPVAGPAIGRRAETPSVRALLRAVRACIAAPVDDDAGTSLELRYAPAGPPRIVPATVVETGFFARVVPGHAEPAFGGFLDGVQESRVVSWTPSGVPVVVGVIGAVVLERGADKRLVAWRSGARVRRVLLVPRTLTDDATWRALEETIPVEDSGAPADSHHPDALLACAVQRVDELRAAEERALAEEWVRDATAPLAADGGIVGLGSAARSPLIVGIVKSHRTLHAETSELPELFALPVGSRTRAFSLVASSARAAACSWYLRLRAATPANPLHGLVRVEVAAADGSPTPRADEVSRWVMAERTPIALPDARWDVMSYGIARCEAYLKRGLSLRARG